MFNNSRQPSFKNPLRIFGIVSLWVGIALTILGIVIYAILSFYGEPFAAMLTLAIIGGQGAIWLIIGVIITGRIKKAARKAAYLKEYGECFKAVEIFLVENHAVRINNAPAVYAECIYVNNQSQRVRVKSTMFMWHRWGQEDTLSALIYVDRQDPSLYTVEMIFNEGANGQIDIDYT